MTKVEELQGKLEKAQAKVTKCEGTITRHQTQLSKKLTAIAKFGINLDNMTEFSRRSDDESRELRSDIYDIKRKMEDIKSANIKLKDAKQIAENWQNKINAELEKDRFLEGNAPQVIKDFLEEWKVKAYDWYVQRYDSYIEFRKKIKADELEAREQCIKTTPEYASCLDENGEVDSYHVRGGMLNMRPSKPMEVYLKERDLDWKSIRDRKTDFAGGVVLRMCEISNEEERLSWLEKTIEADKKAKMIDLINRIIGVTGAITDAKGLYMSAGDINGIVIGEKGSAKVNTISAGGYAVQCWHYRVLIKKLK